MDRPNESDEVDRFLRAVMDVLSAARVFSPPVSGKVIDYQEPQHLEKILKDFTLDESCSESRLLEMIKKTAELSVLTGHPMFFNQLYGGIDQFGLAGALISEALNTSAYTHEVAPVFSLSEREVIKASLKLVGFESGDGIFTPGGSISNMYSLVIARYRKFPEVKQKGVNVLSPLVVYTSQDAHYSVLKGAHWLGLGTDNVIRVKTDGRGKMIPQELEEAIQRTIADGKIPLMVNCTAGTTVLGAFDPLEDISKICQKFNVWMHVDACWGGSLMFSTEHKRRLLGINKADSVSWNPHKMLGAPLQCSLFLMRHKELLKECNMAGATYLFQEDKMYHSSYDSGDKSVQCGRKVDSFKLWVLWKARGAQALGGFVDAAIDASRYFLDKIRDRPGFKLVLDDFETTNICFWYIPLRLRGKEETPLWWEEIHRVAPALKKLLVQDGRMMLGYQPLEHRNLKNFFRLVVTCHPPRTTSHMDRAIELLEKHGSGL